MTEISDFIGGEFCEFERLERVCRSDCVLVTCNYEEDPIKNERARVLTRFSPL